MEVKHELMSHHDDTRIHNLSSETFDFFKHLFTSIISRKSKILPNKYVVGILRKSRCSFASRKYRGVLPKKTLRMYLKRLYLESAAKIRKGSQGIGVKAAIKRLMKGILLNSRTLN